MSEETETSGFSRRSMIKRVGVGAAVVWAAPTLFSLDKASAAGSHFCGDTDWVCEQPLTFCGTSDCALSDCICDVDVDGKPFCWNNYYCSDPDTHACTSNADCKTGWACVSSCCGDRTCAPPCGDCGGVDSQAVRSSLTGAGI